MWNLEEEKEPPRGSDAIQYSAENLQKVGSEERVLMKEEKVTVEENEGVGGAEDRRKVKQEDDMLDVQGEDSSKGGTGDIDWGCRFVAEV